MSLPLEKDGIGTAREPQIGLDASTYRTVISAAHLLRSHLAILIGLPFLIGVLTAAVSLILPPTYSASTSFVPEEGSETRLPSGVAGLAGQLGVSIGRQPTLSPQFYTSVMRSRVLLEHVVLAKFPDPRSSAALGDSATLLDLLKVAGKSPQDSLYNALKKLRERIAVNIENRTDIVYVSVEARYPELAAAVANELMYQLNDFNSSTRRSRARARREFLQERLSAGNDRLAQAESAVEEFLNSNRLWQQSPELVFAEARLRRQVDMQQQVLVSLMREYETAGLEEVNDTPVLTIIEPAIPPTRRAKPRRKLMVLFGLGLGAVLAVFWIFTADRLRQLSAAAEPAVVGGSSTSS